MEQTEKKIIPNKWGIWDYPLLIETLEDMALEGWLLAEYHDKVLEFVATEPRKIKYAVTFFKDYNADGHTPPEDLVYMWQLCETDGWKNVTHNNYIQIFYNENPEAEPFHTDVEVQLENFSQLIDASLVKEWKETAIGMFFYIVIYMGFRVREVLLECTVQGELKTYFVITVILLVFLIYELLHGLFRCVNYRKWYRIARIYAENDGVFMPPYASPAYDKSNFIITAAFCIIYAVAVFVLGSGDNIFGVDGSIITLNAAHLFIMSRIIVNFRIIKAKDEGYIVAVKSRYPKGEFTAGLFAVIVIWVLTRL